MRNPTTSYHNESTTTYASSHFSFSRLGGLLFDREVRSLVSFLSNVTTWSVRDKFSRLTQMSTVLNLETVGEMADIWGSGSSSAHAWKLSQAEVRTVLGLRFVGAFR